MKKQTIFTGIIVLILAFGLCLSACDLGTGENTENNENNNTGNNDNNGNNGNNETIAIDKLSIKTTGIKSLYVSNIPINNSSRAVDNTSVIQTLSYINNVGQNTPFFFVSPSGKNIVLNVSDLQQLDEKRILVDFDSFYEITANENVYTIGETISNTGRALIDMEIGKVYDFKEYTNIQFVSNDLLFTLENQTLYKIDLNNISTAIPLNNPTYYPIIELDPLVLFNDKIIGRNTEKMNYDSTLFIHYSIDINNKFPPKVVEDVSTTIDDLNVYIKFYKEYSSGILIQDFEGTPWFFGSGIIGQISIDDNGKALLSDFSRITIPFVRNLATENIYHKNNMVYMLYDEGFIILKKKVNGIQVEATTLTLPYDITDKNTILKDDYLYYLNETSIKRIYLSVGSSIETIYTNSRILTTGTDINFLTSSGNNLVFYQFDDDNISVNTYSLSMYQPGAEPKLLSSSLVEIKNIVELYF